MEKMELYMQKEWAKYLLCVAGAFVYALGMNLFVTPMGLYAGGVMGISQIIETFLLEPLHLSPGSITGILYFVLNLPLYFMAMKSIGKSFLIKTGINVIFITVFMSIIPVPAKPIVDDMLTGAIIGGITYGVGAGLTLQAGGSGAGLEILGVYLAKKGRNLSVGKLSIVINGMIYTVCLIMFDVKVAIYCIIYAVFCSVVVDRIHTQSINVETMIFTKSDGVAISNIMVNEFGRSATVWKGRGGYTEKDTTIVYAVLSKYEAAILKRMVREVDSHAFIVLNEGCQITGNFPKHL